MGYQLTVAALQPEWGRRLTTTERLVLVIMCQVALDDGADGPPRRYFGGQSFIMLQMRGEVPPKGSPEFRTAAEVIRRALRKLEELGAIKRVRVAAHGVNAEYLLTPDAPQLPVGRTVRRPP